jgi:hypothetical protein
LTLKINLVLPVFKLFKRQHLPLSEFLNIDNYLLHLLLVMEFTINRPTG